MGELSDANSLWLLSAVTCAAVLVDILVRYVIPRKKRVQEDKTLKPSGSAVKIERVHETEHHQLAAREKLQITEKNQKKGELTDRTSAELSASSKSSAFVISNLIEVFRSTVQPTLSVQEQKAADDQVAVLKEVETKCNELSNIFDRMSVQLADNVAESDNIDESSSNETHDDSKLVNFLQRRKLVQNLWLSARRLLYCVDFHLINAATYHQFHSEVYLLKKFLEAERTWIEDVLQSQKSDEDEVTVETIKQLILSLQGVSNHLQLLTFYVRELSETAKQVAPVHTRTEGINRPSPVKAVCNYISSEAKVVENEALMLTENQEPGAWKVTNAVDRQMDLTPLCVYVPPPDSYAIQSAAKVHFLLEDVYHAALQAFLRRCAAVTLGALEAIQGKKTSKMTTMHKNEMLELIDNIQGIVKEELNNAKEFKAISDGLDVIEELVKAADESKDDEFAVYLLDMLQHLYQLLQLLLLLSKGFKTYKEYSVIYERGDMNFLDQEERERLQHQRYQLSVAREKTEVGTSSYVAAEGEMRQTFAIRAVLDPRNNSEMSIDQAVVSGIISRVRGMYINPVTNEELPIGEAMTRGLILVESSQTSQMKESTHGVGVVTVKVTRETKPYSVSKVLDMQQGILVSLAEAIEKGIFNADTGTWKDLTTGEEMSTQDAIDTGNVVAEYDDTVDATDTPVAVEKMFAVYCVIDGKTRKRVPFYEAAERGLIDKDTGEFTDTLTGEKMPILDAMHKGSVKAKLIVDPKDLEDYLSGRSRIRGISESSDASI